MRTPAPIIRIKCRRRQYIMKKYGIITDAILAKLREVVKDEDRIAVGDKVNPEYSQDKMPIYGVHAPDVAIDALTTEEVSGIMKICNDNDIPVTVRGNGTGLVGGAVAMFGGILISTFRMNKVLKWDDEHFAAHIQPGILLGDLQRLSLERGLMYAPDPANRKATVGGNVSTNAGGMRAIKYGTTREYVRGMTAVLPNGEVIKLGANVSKNSTGLNLIQLIASSFGTLAVITELTMKLLKAPSVSHSVMAPFEDLDTALSVVPEILKAGLRPTAIEFFEKEVLYFSEEYVGKKVWPREVDGKKIGAYLLMLFDGDDEAEVRTQTARMEAFFYKNKAMSAHVVEDADEQSEIWAARAAMLTAIFEQHKCYDENDAVIPINNIAEFIRFTKISGEKYDFDVFSVGHAGDGNMHIFSASNDLTLEAFKKQSHEWMLELYAKAKELGGELSGEHGVGNGKIGYFEHYVGPRVFELNQEIKRLFDPKLILNPGKLCFYPEKMEEYRN